MKMNNRFVAVGAMLLTTLATAASSRADALDQVPADALVVLKVKDLDGTSKKVAKWAKELGIDQQDPAWADPLGALAEKTHLGKGVDRAGDLAVAMLDPEQFGGEGDKSVLVLVPTSNYKAFVGNFKASTDEGDGISKATPHEGTKDVFVASWGQYAAVSPNKAVVAKKPTGLKLTGFSAKESAAKDAVLYVNMKVLRAKLLPEIKKGRDQALGLVDNALAGQGENGKKYAPLAKAVANQILNVAEEFVNDAHSATVGLNITDAGVGLTYAADFEPTSYIGKLALQTKGTSASMLNGLPDRKYLFFGGTEADPKVTAQLMADLIDPIVKELAAVDDSKKILPAVESTKKAYASATGWTIGMVAPTGPLGQESVIQQVAVMRGDAKLIQESQRTSLQVMTELMQTLQQQAGNQAGISSKFELKPDAKTIGGVKFDAYETKMTFRADEAQAQQAQQMLSFIYGPNGMTGVLGVVDDKSLLMVQGGSDELIADAVTAAKANADTLGAMAGVREAAAGLPKERSLVAYLDLGTIVNTSLRYAKGVGVAPPNVKLAADLPPIGFSSGTEGTAFRGDLYVPNRLVQGMVSAYMDAMRPQNNPNGGL